jgi:superfamily II DNA or RNA helicase
MEAELAALRAENARLRGLLGLDDRRSRPATSAWRPTLFPAKDEVPRTVTRVGDGSALEERIALYRSLFIGRDDVFALAWSNQRSSKSGWAPAVRGGWANSKSTNREYLPFTEEVLRRHLAGEIHAGLYPLLPQDECRLLACDFDGPGWVLDALAYLDAAHDAGVPALLERSRSGEGGHVWIFFAGRVKAPAARRLGVYLVREAMTVRADLDLTTYDRLFPTQDFVPKGSFGNLIALPLQGQHRQRDMTVFLDPSTLEPFGDQWECLSSIESLSSDALDSLASGIRDLASGPDAQTYRRPTRPSVSPTPPPTIPAQRGAMLAIDRIGVPPALVAALKHLASLHNPDFYKNERLRYSTWNTPRFIRCYQETLGQLLLPRGLQDKAKGIVAEAGSTLTVTEMFAPVRRIAVQLGATLAPEQAEALRVLCAHDLGVLVAPPASGKTVIGCALIAEHRVPTLVIVDRKPLVEQWRSRLVTHLDLEPHQIGQLGGGRNKPTGVVDVAMAQSLARRDDIAELTAGYGLVIVNECHHVPAVTFQRAVREIPVRRWVGLTATPYRRDGLQAMMAMHCGPVRHTIVAPSAATRHALDLIVHETDHRAEEGQHIQTTFRGLVEDEKRTAAICDDIATASMAGRRCLVLTRWREHLDGIVQQLNGRGVDALVLHGQMGKKARAAVVERLAGPLGQGVGLVLAATASLLGEGFDCPPLDTLFLAFPIRFKGSVVQYVGRVLRPTDEKTSVVVHDYVDTLVPVLARMHNERRAAYASLGFDIPAQGRRGGSLRRRSGRIPSGQGVLGEAQSE